MRGGRLLHGYGGVPRRGIFLGLHHALGGRLSTVVIVALLLVVVVLAVRGRR